MHLTPSEALQKLNEKDELFLELFKHGTLSVEIYQPDKVDHQTPHERDEVYVIIAGAGEFFCEGKYVSFKAGDFLFVSAGAEHRFENFTEDFVTWVIFYGPKGGEKKNK